MKCPYCHSEMEYGELRSRGGVYFLPDGESMPKLPVKLRALRFPLKFYLP